MPKTLEELQHDLAVEEYKALRQEIIQSIAGAGRLELYVTVAVAALYPFLLSNAVPKPDGTGVLPLPLWCWALPIFFPVLGMIRLRAHEAELRRYNEYLRYVEQEYRFEGGRWEHFVERPEQRRRSGVWATAHLYFVLLLLFTVAVFASKWLRLV